MTFSLYDASVANYLQTLGAVDAFLERGRAHFVEHKIDPESIVEARLAPDMLPLRFQILSVVHHSRGAIDAAKSGAFHPPGAKAADYAALQAMVKQAHDHLAAITPAAVNALAGGDVIFHIGERKIPFTTENFLMSFSLPNFYFHATTAYAILRHHGAPLGKRNFLGAMRIKT